jgi:DNA-binding CsgD family transcriptional regulator
MSKYLYALSPKEKEVYYLIINDIKGHSYKELAKEMHITESTLKTHIDNIFQKMGINSRNELIVKHYKNMLDERKN